MQIDVPWRIDGRGRTATTDDDEHIRDMLELLLFTHPGERVNRSDFGTGLLHMVFASASPEIAAALQFTVQAAIQRWLGDLIEVRNLTVTHDDASLRVSVEYMVRRTNQRNTADLIRTI